MIVTGSERGHLMMTHRYWVGVAIAITMVLAVVLFAILIAVNGAMLPLGAP